MIVCQKLKLFEIFLFVFKTRFFN